MKFVRAIWKLLVGIKDALVLVLMLLFFAGLYSVLSARPAPIRDGVLDVNLNGAVVEQPSRAQWADVASGNAGAKRLIGPSSLIKRLTMPRAGRPENKLVRAVWRALALLSAARCTALVVDSGQRR